MSKPIQGSKINLPHPSVQAVATRSMREREKRLSNLHRRISNRRLDLTRKLSVDNFAPGPNDKNRPLISPSKPFFSLHSLLLFLSLSLSLFLLLLPSFASPATAAFANLHTFNVTSLLFPDKDFSIQRNPIETKRRNRENSHGSAEKPVQAYKNLIISYPLSNHPISNPKPIIH